MKLKNYYIQFDMCNNPYYAYGEVYGNPKFKDGTKIKTSAILVYDKDKKYIKTRNNIYLLEEPIIVE